MPKKVVPAKTPESDPIEPKPIQTLKGLSDKLMPMINVGEDQGVYVARVHDWWDLIKPVGSWELWEQRALEAFGAHPEAALFPHGHPQRVRDALPPSTLGRTRDYLDIDVQINGYRIVATEHGESMIAELKVGGEEIECWVNGEVVAAKLVKLEGKYPVIGMFTKKGKYYDVA
ncbi:MAG: hypothetical protein Q7N50_04010 [Armatimonadota bacterium]|nr:hypothetical protein [Armatimonadota bacterium]